MGVLKRVVKLSRADFKTLTDKGTVTVDGQTIEYSNDDIYVVPNIEIDHSQYIDISSNQVIKGVKTFEGSAGTVRLGLNGCVEAVDENSYSTLICGAFIQNIGDSGYMDISYNTGIRVYDMLNGTNSIVKLPMGKMGTLATTDDCKKLYRHRLEIIGDDGNRLIVYITSSKATAYTASGLSGPYAPNCLGAVALYSYDNILCFSDNNPYIVGPSPWEETNFQYAWVIYKYDGTAITFKFSDHSMNDSVLEL
jgi:hypothetical protein